MDEVILSKLINISEKIVDVDAKLNGLVYNISSLKDDISNLENEYKDLSKTLSEFTININSHYNKIQFLENKVEKLEKKLDTFSFHMRKFNKIQRRKFLIYLKIKSFFHSHFFKTALGIILTSFFLTFMYFFTSYIGSLLDFDKDTISFFQERLK